MDFTFKINKQITWERSRSSDWRLSDVRELFRYSPFYEKLQKNDIPNASFGILIKKSD
jgi:hypothetical protein